MVNDYFTRLNRHLQAEILARIDGPTLAAATCACPDLRAIAEEDKLWENLCSKTWPSTLDEKARDLISNLGGFNKFFANSFPLIVYKPIQGKSLIPKDPKPKTQVSPSSLMSLVDVYYQKKCVFSKVLHVIPGAVDRKEYSDERYLDRTFILEALNYRSDNGVPDNDDYYDDDDDDDEETVAASLPSVPLMQKKDRHWKTELCKILEKNVRLSWVVLDKNTGEAVNLSSWKPLTVRSYFPSLGDFVMRFGCAVPVEKGLVGSQSAECVISMRCRVMERGECLTWRHIGLQFEDMDGSLIDGRRSMVVLERAVRCVRNRNWWAVGSGYEEYVKEKRQMKEKKLRNERIVGRMYAFAAVAVFAGLCFFTL